MTQNPIQSIVVGALVGTALGAISALLLPQSEPLVRRMKSQTRGMVERARDMREDLRDVGQDILGEVKEWSYPRRAPRARKFIVGAILGLFSGAAAALLLAPKSGRLLRKDLVQGYQDLSNKTEEFVHIFNNHSSPILKKVVRPLRRKISSSKPQLKK